MKQRIDYVSNSSSSSFCVIGVCGSSDKFVQEFYEKNKESIPVEDGYLQDSGPYHGSAWAKDLVVFAQEGDDEIEVWCIGLPIETALDNDNMTLKQAKEKVAKLFAAAGVDIPVGKLEIVCEESGNG